MKKINFILILAITMVTRTYAQYANQTLSNLTSTPAVNVSLLPGTDNSINLGGSSNAWKNIYFDGSMFLDGQKFISNGFSGVVNTFIGSGAGNYDSLSYGQPTYNTGVGYQVLYKNKIGTGNTACGYKALYSDMPNDYTSYNTATGYEALYNNTTGSGNTATGSYSLISNTTGPSNTANGNGALYHNTTGDENTATGSYALYSNNTGEVNTALGYEALFKNTTALDNTAAGYLAGSNVITGPYNTFFGANANCGSQGTLTSSTAIGYGATVTSSNHMVFGNSSVTSIGGYVNWTNISDGRVKKNIKENVPGLAFISKLKPITYNLDLEAADKIIQRPPDKDKDGNVVQLTPEELTARKEKEQVVYSGFIAQDVEKSAGELKYDFSGVDAPQNENSVYGLRYADFVVPLVKSMQELSKLADDNKANLDDLQKQIDDLKAVIETPQLQGKDGFAKLLSATEDPTTLLGQNIPNPFGPSTFIPFRIPKDCRDASIMITNNSTSEVLTILPVSCNEDHVQIDAGTLADGSYSYSLYVNGKIIDTKQMVLTR